jgi:hypothetical protein
MEKFPGKVPRKAPPDTGNPADPQSETGMVTKKSLTVPILLIFPKKFKGHCPARIIDRKPLIRYNRHIWKQEALK